MICRDEVKAAAFWFLVAFAIVLSCGVLTHGAGLDSYYARINEFRASPTNIDGSPKDPLPPLAVNACLEKAASAYAKLCSRTVPANQSWGHYVGGTSPMDRVTAAGYFDADQASPNGYYGSVGECTMNPARLDPVWVWIMSDGHRAVLLNPMVTEMGLGKASGKSSGWVLDVAVRRPRDSAAQLENSRTAVQKQCASGT